MPILNIVGAALWDAAKTLGSLVVKSNPEEVVKAVKEVRSILHPDETDEGRITDAIKLIFAKYPSDDSNKASDILTAWSQRVEAIRSHYDEKLVDFYRRLITKDNAMSTAQFIELHAGMGDKQFMDMLKQLSFDQKQKKPFSQKPVIAKTTAVVKAAAEKGAENIRLVDQTLFGQNTQNEAIAERNAARQRLAHKLNDRKNRRLW